MGTAVSEDNPKGSENRSQLEDRYQATQQELRELHRKMDTIRQEVGDEVDRQWVSIWRSDEMFDVKVGARLSSHPEYRSLLGRLRELELVQAALAKELDSPRREEGGPA